MKPQNLRFFLASLLCCSSLSFGASPCAMLQHTGVKDLLAQGAVVSEAAQMDYGRIAVSSTCYLEAWPDSTASVAALVRIAYANNIPIRTQGAAHSTNGAALPRQAELLIHTTHLNQLAFPRDTVVNAGAGIPVVLLQRVLREHTSYFLAVGNGDGGIGPTIGGFISAGGISNTSITYGGFWEHVYAVTLVIANGDVITVKRHDFLFPYLFGSMGQLGIITEATLELLPAEGKSHVYPQGKTLRLPYPSSQGIDWAKPSAVKPNYWFNLFVPDARIEEADHALTQLLQRYPHAMAPVERYHQAVTYVSFMPPLVYDKDASFMDVGMMGPVGTYADSHEQLRQLETAFSQWVLAQHFRRYVQSERQQSPAFFAAYYAPDTLSRLKALKQLVDPKFLFDRGVVFDDQSR